MPEVSGEMDGTHGGVIMWMDLSKTPDWNDIEACIKYLGEKGVLIDDAKCFDQLTNLKKFTERCNSDGDFSDLQAHKKWTKYFERSKSTEFYSELLKIAQFLFAIPSHNANVESFFTDAKPVDKEKESLVC